ncbi:uncharacterized protein LOC131891444 [Tigriopus californicus]|uniref:uncharacterized protein LOC131891444 n=1 Tax=Tigriopus californicus TaxID=6832 RepID=UPI0027DA9752|nr:uncharacterized protein LOC131891444 [Tigriopus californicus]
MRFLAIGLLAMSLLFCQSVSSFYLKRSDSRSHFSMLSSPSRPEIVPSDSEVPKNHRVAVVPTNGRSRSKRQLVLHGDDPQTAIIREGVVKVIEFVGYALAEFAIPR